MSTTLPLFWDLSAASSTARIDASVKLISALEHFQAQHVPKDLDDAGESQEKARVKSDGLDVLNAQDVSYSIRRFVRGLASPRESSRLGFAVALTELLSRINTVTCAQIVALILDSSKNQGSMNGQEKRDVLFARLFGFTSVIQSGLLFRDTPLPTSASSSTQASSLSSYKDVLAQLLALGEKKSWLRESAWWAIGLAIDAMHESNVSWKDDAVDATLHAIYTENKLWTPEKMAVTLKLRKRYPSRDWKELTSPTFKNPDLLSTANLYVVARVLKEINTDEDEEKDLPNPGVWKPQVHSVWDMLLDEILSDSTAERTRKASFPEFFRIVVDESLFAPTASPQRKYWGFQVFQKALPRISANEMPMLFTKNFMRSWINHLSNSDRYLHKIARQVATDIHALVKQNPTVGFTLILQLTGVNGSRQFDNLTKTKTVESILASMDNDGIQAYIDFVLRQVNDEKGAETTDVQTLNSRRAWVIEQLTALIRNGAIQKSEQWVQSILDWLVVHGLFVIKKKSEKSAITALRSSPSPPFSDELRRQCRERLLSCLAELTSQHTRIKDGEKVSKLPAVASDGEFWVSKVLSTIEKLEKDSKHVTILTAVDEDEQEMRVKARQVAEHLKTIQDDRQEAARGAELLLMATLLHHYCADDDADLEALESCIDGASRMFPEKRAKHKKKSRKSSSEAENSTEEKAPEPVDVLVDTIISLLEKATAYMRAVANQAFSMLSGSVQESTIELILTQLERRGPSELLAGEDEEMDGEEGSDSSEDEKEEEESLNAEKEEEEEEEEGDDEEGLELRRKIEEALRVNGVEPATGETDDESDEELMDDEQMLAIDEQLAALFKARTSTKKGKHVDAQREATHFKNRILELLEIFIKKQPTNPLIIRLILPSVNLIFGSGSDEKQLADKATGILRSRLGKSREVPVEFDSELAVQVLEELHSRARRAPSSNVLVTLSQCSLYVAKLLHHAGQDEPIIKAYRESLSDFVTRKSSKLNTNFFLDFARRLTNVAWNLRDSLLEAGGNAVNVYRQCQVYQILYSLLNQLPELEGRQSELIKFIPTLRRSLQDIISGACASTHTHTAAQIKELLKLVQLAVRHSRKVLSTPEEISDIWDPPSWTALASKLAHSDRLKASAPLQAICKSIARSIGETTTSVNEKSVGRNTMDDATSSKRKASELEDKGGEEMTIKKAKRKKAKKAVSQ
ncbi:uncharacterized protein LAESUDRAFT_720895 [Laetiporus sulphureus 93-53]|uniref:DNA polymerase phi-domain-containing protein n=1 Tax=Laetiporus sulphureus 93-53 TaxID=1314785 RepID=A0A165HEM4_9APHY|nr:uncharacterized protein LAESUDRAFT_720895 [Laetiporus sulphureus 93-53]KZT11636.1 hypothetical protein LAESUDRAFT_720895 [Laetiporus sulphureus 93-53]